MSLPVCLFTQQTLSAPCDTQKKVGKNCERYLLRYIERIRELQSVAQFDVKGGVTTTLCISVRTFSALINKAYYFEFNKGEPFCTCSGLQRNEHDDCNLEYENCWVEWQDDCPGNPLLVSIGGDSILSLMYCSPEMRIPISLNRVPKGSSILGVKFYIH